MRAVEFIEEVGRGNALCFSASIDGFEDERPGQSAFARPRWAHEDQRLALGYEIKFSQFLDQSFIERGLQRPRKRFQGPEFLETGALEGVGQDPVSFVFQLASEQLQQERAVAGFCFLRFF